MTEPSDKPLDSLIRFAAALGWPELRIFHHCIDGDQPFIATWYESGVSGGLPGDFFLQFNEAPSGQTSSYVGAVYAMRYRICSGWHQFTLFSTTEEILAEASNVEPWLHRRWYESLKMRREFRRLHPECANYSWPRIREQGPPYSQDGVATAPKKLL